MPARLPPHPRDRCRPEGWTKRGKAGAPPEGGQLPPRPSESPSASCSAARPGRFPLPSRRRLPPALRAAPPAGPSPPPAPPRELVPGRAEGRAGTCPGGDEQAAGALERCWRRLLPRHAHLLPCSWRSPVRRAARRDAAPQAPTPKRPPLPAAPASRLRRAGWHRSAPLRALPHGPGGAAAPAGRAGGGTWGGSSAARSQEGRGEEREAAEWRRLFNFALLRGEGAAALAPLPSAAASRQPGSGCCYERCRAPPRYGAVRCGTAPLRLARPRRPAELPPGAASPRAGGPRQRRVWAPASPPHPSSGESCRAGELLPGEGERCGGRRGEVRALPHQAAAAHPRRACGP